MFEGSKINAAVVGTILISLMLAGCATTQRLATPSGKPEVNINTTDREK